ncbi:MAG: hypothetical protein MUC57_20425 [Desulfobacterales bacterium]|nr:hypothetical protein [Desulfobacterales bacterium]
MSIETDVRNPATGMALAARGWRSTRRSSPTGMVSRRVMICSPPPSSGKFSLNLTS